MPPKAKSKKKATEHGLISSRLRERRSEIYDEDVADEEDAEAELLECASDDEAGAEAQAAPSVAAGRGKGRGICCRRLALSSASRLFAPQARRASPLELTPAEQRFISGRLQEAAERCDTTVVQWLLEPPWQATWRGVDPSLSPLFTLALLSNNAHAASK